MKKLIYLIVLIVALALIIAGCGIPVVPPVEQNEPSSLTKAGTTWTVGPAGCDFTTIQAAITAANPTDTIQVAAGTYNEGALVFDKDDITLIGSGADTTTIITSSNNYGVYVPSGVDYITIKNFTIEEDESNNGDVCLPSGTSRFHLKISHNSGFTLENVKLHGPGKEFSCITGLDLHTVQDVTIKNVEITGYSKNGVGVTATTSGLLFEDVTIDDNGYTDSTGWAGISFYTMGGGDITDVQFLGTNTISNNPMGVYVENVGGDVIITGTSTTTLSGNSVSPLVTTNLGNLLIVDIYAKNVFNVPVRLENAFATPPNSMIVGYWHDVTSAGEAANNPLVDGNPIIFNLTNGEWYVVAGINMNIQAAIDVASDGDTINVTAGIYPEAITIDVANLTLKSETSLGAIIRPTTTPAGWPEAVIYITADGVTVDGFEVDGTLVADNGILGWETSGLTIKNNKIHGAVRDWDGCGILLFSWGNGGTVYDNLIENNEVYDTGRMGIMVMDLGANYSVTPGNTITGNTVYDVWKNPQGDHGGGIQINVGKDCEITNNEVYDVRNGQRGIYMFGSAAGNIITGNILTNNEIGIQIWISGEGGTTIDWGGETATSPEVHFNEIYGNSSYGAISTNESGAIPMVMEATYNWWGDVSGPFDELDTDGLNQYNPYGLGDPVSEYVQYDPWVGQEGMVTGGGWIMSPAGAYTSDPSLSGKATFGFVSRYKKGAAVPTGKTQFNFQVADLNFHSDSCDWLVVAGAKAMFKGTGTINGTGDYGFMLSAIDADINESDIFDLDRFRIKIWDKGTDTVIYDNKQDGEDGTEIGGGQIVIHKAK